MKNTTSQGSSVPKKISKKTAENNPGTKESLNPTGKTK